MTDKIIKALECCTSRSFKNYACVDCPMVIEPCYGGEILKKQALDLIKRQKEEIESLKDKLNHSTGVDNTKENGCFPFD